MNVLIIGVSTKPHKFSNLALKLLVNNNIQVNAIGLREADIYDVHIHKGFPELENIHTVILYIAAENQKDYYNYILNLKPKRIIFNPGTINEEFIDLAKENNIQTIIDCSINMISDLRFFEID